MAKRNVMSGKLSATQLFAASRMSRGTQESSVEAVGFVTSASMEEALTHARPAALAAAVSFLSCEEGGDTRP